MKNKRYTLSFLLFISITMLAVPVIPHHHCANGVICMKNDVTPEPQCPRHHHHPGDDSYCNDGCMTCPNSLTSSVQADSSPYYLFTAILSTDLIMGNLFKSRKRCIKNCYTYRGSLYSTVVDCAFSLYTSPYSTV